MTYTKHSYITANTPPQNRKNAGELDSTPLHKAAPYMRHTVLTNLTPYLN
jgi:hypothetical protein